MLPKVMQAAQKAPPLATMVKSVLPSGYQKAQKVSGGLAANAQRLATPSSAGPPLSITTSPQQASANLLAAPRFREANAAEEALKRQQAAAFLNQIKSATSQRGVNQRGYAAYEALLGPGV